MHEETVYDSLAEAHDDQAHWVFGQGFDDPLAGVDTTLPEGVDPSDLGSYCLMLGDDALVLAQRMTEWITNAPELEEEVAIANIALDLLGQARLLLARAASAGVMCGSRDRAGAAIPDEDALAYFRDPAEFRSTTLVETPNGDFAHLMVRLLIASTARLAVLGRLRRSTDPVLAAVAAKAVAETAYHRDHAARWVIRLGDGTAESRRRTQEAVTALWPLVAETVATTDVERRLAGLGVAVDPATIAADVRDALSEVLGQATLPVPQWPAPVAPRGRLGEHGPDLGDLLAAMQSLAREHPTATW